MFLSSVLRTRFFDQPRRIPLTRKRSRVDESDSGRGIKNVVSGSVTEWSVDVDAEGAVAGEVSFSITNRGTIDHEFLVVQ